MKMGKGLKNPAVISAVASSPQGQKAIGDSLSIVKNLFLFSVVGVAVYVGYKVFVNRFTSLNYDLRYRPATISSASAKSKADSIYRAMYGLGNGYNVVAQNLKGLSHNDFIKVYNEFGGRKGITDVFEKMNLLEWLTDQFDSSELLRLKVLIPDFL